MPKKRDRGSSPTRKVVINRPLPFSASRESPSDGASRSHRQRHSRGRRRSNSGDSDGSDGGGGTAVRAQRHALQAFRFLCRSGQLFLAEQLALAGVWDVGASDGDGVGVGEEETSNSTGRTARSGPPSEGLRTAWMTSRLKPAMRSALKERREKVRRALEDLRRFAGPRGAIFLLPRVGVETLAAATTDWDVRVVPSQRDIIRGAGSLWGRRG